MRSGWIVLNKVANKTWEYTVVNAQMEALVKRGTIRKHSEPVEVRPGVWDVDVYCAHCTLDKPIGFVTFKFKK